MSIGRINVTLEQSTIDQIQTTLDAIEILLPFLIRLTADEKTRLVKPRVGAGEVMQTIANLQREAGMPPDANDPMLFDHSVYTGLTALSDRITNLLQRIDDTRLLAGSEGWNESLIRYGMLRQVQRRKPELKAGLDRIRPLITSRSNRPAPAPIEDEPATPSRTTSNTETPPAGAGAGRENASRSPRSQCRTRPLSPPSRFAIGVEP